VFVVVALDDEPLQIFIGELGNLRVDLILVLFEDLEFAEE